MHGMPDLLDGLRRAPAILREFAESIPEPKLNARRGVGFWTIAEHINHLAHVQPILLERINRFIAEDHPEFVPYLPDKDSDAPAAAARINLPEVLEDFTKYRNKQVALLKNAGEKIWRRTGKHPEYDLYSLHILVRHILMHDHWHMYRMEELWLTKDAYLTRLE